MEPQILAGSADEALPGDGYGDGSGSGYGSGDGYGDGYGYGDGSGYGSGYGYGDGSGSGYGSGYGSGDGYGDGYGSGDGDGYGYGDSDSDGDGSGSGSGSGDGYGSGDSDGYGSGSYWLACMRYFMAKLDVSQQSRAADLVAAGCSLAYWRSDERGRPANGGSGVTAEPGAVHKTSGPLSLCSSGTLHATLIPPKWQGSRWWIVALHGEVIGDDEKLGCLEREIIGECL